MVEVNIVKGDRQPSITATLVNCGDLSGATARFIMIDQAGTIKVDASAVIADADAKKVRYDWGENDTDTVGVYYGEFEITYADGKKQTFPAKDKSFVIRIRPEYG